MPRTILLIDGDQYLHRGCAAVEHDARWDEQNHVLVSNAEEAWDVVSGSLRKVIDHFSSIDPVICLSECDELDYRKITDPTYKAKRVGARKPLCFYDLKDKLKAEMTCRFIKGLEADDVMGILATKPGPDTKIIVSRDKDMKTIPGKLWDGGKFHVITEAQANYWHLYQTLIGDAVDGYKGCPGVGPKGAEKLLNVQVPTEAFVSAAWTAVLDAFAKAGLTADDALRQARLARILRWSDWDSKKKEPIPWMPA